MATYSHARELQPNERAQLHFLLSIDFPGRNELRKQLDRVAVVGDCDCGCGTVDLMVSGPATHADVRKQIPVEAYGKGVDVLLFVRDGLLAALEIVDHGDSRPLKYPTPDGLELRAYPRPTSDA